jgi:hypothetical protein
MPIDKVLHACYLVNIVPVLEQRNMPGGVMKKYTRNIVLSVLISALAATSMLLLSSAFSADEKTKKMDGKTLFETKCLKCHKPAKFKEQASDRKGWVLTLSRMQRGTCQITDEELEVLADYLAKVYGD